MSAEMQRRESCAPGSRNGWYMADCVVHGLTSHNTIIEGCEACARARIEGERGEEQAT